MSMPRSSWARNPIRTLIITLTHLVTVAILNFKMVTNKSNLFIQLCIRETCIGLLHFDVYAQVFMGKESNKRTIMTTLTHLAMVAILNFKMATNKINVFLYLGIRETYKLHFDVYSQVRNPIRTIIATLTHLAIRQPS